MARGLDRRRRNLSSRPRKRGTHVPLQPACRLAPGNTREAMTWATGINEKVNQVTGLNVGLYAQTFSPEVGTLSWSTFVPDLPTLKPPTTSCSWTTHTFRWSTRAPSSRRLVLTTPCCRSFPANPIRAVRSNTPRPCRQCARAESHQRHRARYRDRTTGRENSGHPVLFATAATGNYGAVAWLSGYADVREMERAQQALAADAQFGSSSTRTSVMSTPINPPRPSSSSTDVSPNANHLGAS